VGVELGSSEGTTPSSPLVVAEADRLVKSWLRAVGWAGPEVLEAKVELGQTMVEEMEAVAVDPTLVKTPQGPA
jgi:hypothetical protein